jgi:heme exporter protein B
VIGSLFGAELRVLFRDRSRVINPLAFLFLGVVLFAVAVPPGPGPARELGGAFIWLLVLLTNILALDATFRRDYDNGMLEQALIAAQPAFVAVLVRIVVLWLHTGLLISLLAPVLALALGIPHVSGRLVLALLLGTPALSFIGAIGASLTVGFSRGGVLLALLTLPLYLPVLVFGAHAVNAVAVGSSGDAQLYWLAFISMLAITIGPFATTAGLRISLQLQ